MTKLETIFNTYWEATLTRLPDFLEGAVILIVFVIIARLVNALMIKRLQEKTEDKLRARFISRVLKNAILLLGLMLAMKAAGYGEVAAGLMAGAGVSAFVIGFALKDIGENFLAGFLLSFSRPFRVNDTIEVDGITGKVKAVNLRNSHVKTFDGKDVFIPNATLIKQNLKNHTLDGYMRHEFTLGVDYETDFAKARDIIQMVLKTTDGIAEEHASSSVNYDSLGASTYNVKVQYWKDMFDSEIGGSALKTLLVERCLAALSDAEIGMPGDIIELRPLPKLMVEEEMDAEVMNIHS